MRPRLLPAPRRPRSAVHQPLRLTCCLGTLLLVLAHHRTVTPMYSKPYVFGPKVFELISYRMYSPTLCIRCRCYSMDGYSRSGCESLASHRNCMCVSLSLSLLVIVLLLTVISAETSAAEKNGSFAIKVSCIICSTLSGKRNLLQRRPFDRCTVEHSVEVAQ